MAIKKGLFLSLLAIVALGALLLVSCAKATPTPTLRPTATPTAAAVTATPTPTPSGPQAPAPKNAKGNVVFAIADLAIPVGLPRLGPYNHMTGYSEGFGDKLFHTQWDAQGGPEYGVPLLAQSWTVADDASKVSIKLKEGVQFHKGWGELTAEDVVWFLNDNNAATNPDSKYTQAGDLASCFGEATQVDKYTLEIKFTTFNPLWAANILSEQDNWFISKKAYDEKGEDWTRDNLIGTGPFEVTEWSLDDFLFMTAVKNHWDRPPKIDTLKVIEVPEPSSRAAMLRTGEVDIAMLHLKDCPTLEAEGFVNANPMQKYEIIGLVMVGNLWMDFHAGTGEPLEPWNQEPYAQDYPWIGNPWGSRVPYTDTDNPAGMDDMEQARLVRWALAESLDRDAINEEITSGYGINAQHEYVQITNPYWDDKWLIPYDAEDARAKLAEAGYPNGFYIEVHFGGELKDLNFEAMDAVAAYWAAIGLTVKESRADYGAVVSPMLRGREAKYPVMKNCDQPVNIWPMDWYHGLTETSVTRPGWGCGFESPLLWEKYVEGQFEADKAKRIAIGQEVMDYMYHQMLLPGVLSAPNMITYNPKSVASWKMRPMIYYAWSNPEDIVPAAR